MKAVGRLLAGLLLGVALVGAVWFGGWIEPPESLARGVAAFAAVYPGPAGEAEVERLECRPLEKIRIYVVCTRGCEDVWRVVMLKGLQATLLANPGRITPEEVGVSRRRINAAVGREALRLDAGSARAMAACYLRLEGLNPELVLPEGGLAGVEEARAGGEEAMRQHALALADPGAEERIPIDETPEGFTSEMLYWDTFRAGHPVLRIRLRMARDGQVREMTAEPVMP